MAPKNLDTLPDDARVATRDVAQLLAKSKPTIFRYIASGILPRTQSIPPGARPTHRLGDVRNLLRGAAPAPKR